MARWLAFRAFTAMARVQSLVGELRSHKLHSAAKKKGFNLRVVNEQTMYRRQS